MVAVVVGVATRVPVVVGVATRVAVVVGAVAVTGFALCEVILHQLT